jgi:ABC-type transport system involved in cytochrome c biogenesis permease subunit
MKRFLPWIIAAVAALWIGSNCRLSKSAAGNDDLVTFGRIPVLSDGRIKPFDTVARNSLLIINGKQRLCLEDGHIVEPMQWLADLLFKPSLADRYPSFVINNPEVLGLFGWQQSTKRYFSFTELDPFLEKIDAQGQAAENIPSAKRTPYQTGIRNLRTSLLLYQRLKTSLRPEGVQSFADGIDDSLQTAPTLLEVMGKRTNGKKFNQQALDDFSQFEAMCRNMASLACLLPVPPQTAVNRNHEEWISIGTSLLQSIPTGKPDPVTAAYALIGDSYHAGNPTLFNQHLSDISHWMKAHEPTATAKATYEYFFNQLEPFYQAMGLYVLAFLLICAFWLGENPILRRAAVWILLLTLAIHTLGLLSRMYLQGRPPVTNLYSSAVFIGWATVLIGLLLERIFRDGIGAACASAIGFITLIIAHHLAASGDTLEMLQAVLDTNIWLATHVVCITIGYSAMFLAGMLAILYVIRGVFTRSLSRESAQSLARMTYGVICFATLFSFVGTVLGGIWADQSWGRFWGWDPKENGALLIVLWCAITLHARLGGYIRERGLMIMALFGNVITSFSWFGVNMLGVGLHSYGFMNKAVPWLAAFMISQLALMAIASMPLNRWRSFRSVR